VVIDIKTIEIKTVEINEWPLAIKSRSLGKCKTNKAKKMNIFYVVSVE